MIVQATSGDAAAVCQIVTRAAQDLEDKGIFQWDEIYPDMETISKDIERQELYLYKKNGIIKGTITLNEYQDEEYAVVNWQLDASKILVVHRVCTDPACQGQGIGKCLMTYAEQFGAENGYDVIRLDAFTQNPISCRFYEQIGYRKTGIVTFRKGQFYCFEKQIS